MEAAFWQHNKREKKSSTAEGKSSFSSEARVGGRHPAQNRSGRKGILGLAGEARKERENRDIFFFTE